MSNEQAAQTPLEDLRKSAMEQYEKLSDEAHHWNSFIIHAIENIFLPVILIHSFNIWMKK